MRWYLAGVVCAVAVLAAACGGGRESADGASGSDTTGATGGSGSSVGPDTSGCPPYSGAGITDDEVVFGASVPLSGPAAAATNTWMGTDAYFSYLNDQGGVEMQDGKTRKLTLKLLDDQAQAPRTKANVDELVNQDQVFALLGVFGTAGNAAVAADIDRFCVPSLFPQVGTVELSGPDHPWFLTGIPVYQQEAQALAEYLEENEPAAEVAVLYQNDDLGRASYEGFEAAIEGTGLSIVAAESYEITDADVAAQMTTLANSGADVFLNAAFAQKCVQAFNDAQARGWEPLKMAMITCGSVDLLASANPGASDGTIQAVYKKDVNTDADDPAVAQYLEWFGKDHAGANPSAGMAGWGYGQWVEQVLREMPDLTRAGLIGTAGEMVYESGAFYEGITQQADVGEGDYFPLEGFLIVQLDQAGKLLPPIQPRTVFDYNGELRL